LAQGSQGAMGVRMWVLLCACAAFNRRSPGQDPRKDLPGMKRDAFDDLLEGSGRPGFGGGAKKPQDLDPVCPEGDGTAPFAAMVIVDKEIFVKVDEDGPCLKLLELGQANMSRLVETSRRECGRGWKEKLVEAMSVIYTRSDFEWPTEPDSVLPIVVEGSDVKQVTLTEAKYESAKQCWKTGCGCAQTSHPKMTALFVTCGAVMLGGVLWDGQRLVRERANEKKRKEEKRKRKEEKRKRKEEEAAAAGTADSKDGAPDGEKASPEDAPESPNGKASNGNPPDDEEPKSGTE